MRAVVIAFAALVAISLTSSDALAKVRSGDRAAELGSTKTARGKKLRLKKYRGKIVVLTFGASWCDPCAKELPAYEKLSKKYSKKNVVFIAVNIDSKVSTGKKFVRKSGLKNVVVGYDPKKSALNTWDPPTMPSTFIIDRKGIVRKLHRGYEKGDDKGIAKAIAKLK
ncbi:MAG: TlpA family protein disulfide reductase [Deltaproteobacteria bacterium]|nr:TlpA family protein disulfide reductase [Deltaproteobacteria bacterium]